MLAVLGFIVHKGKETCPFQLSISIRTIFCVCVSSRHQRSWKMTLTSSRRTMILAAGLVYRLKMTSLLLDRVLG